MPAIIQTCAEDSREATQGEVIFALSFIGLYTLAVVGLILWAVFQ